MKKKQLTDKLIRSLKPEAAEYMITGNDGFYVRVLPSGIKTFWYRFTLGGKRHKMNLGQYPETSLAEANNQHDKAKIQVREGIDPRREYTPELKPEQLTIAALAEKWCTWSEKHHSKKWANTLSLALKKTYYQITASGWPLTSGDVTPSRSWRPRPPQPQGKRPTYIKRFGECGSMPLSGS